MNFPKFQFRMMTPPQYRSTYSNTSMRNIQNRKEYYDKHGQIICITLSPVSSHKLPLLVKFPRMTSYFRRMGPYQNNSEGLFNSVYYVLRKYDKETLPIGNTCGISNYSYSFDMWDRVKRTQMYAILNQAYRDVSRNVYITSQCQVHMNREEQLYNFRTDPQLNANGNYLKSNHF